MGWVLGIFRRLFGGSDSKFDFLEQRCVQMIVCILAVFCLESPINWAEFFTDFAI
jgi:hypothetical protein